MADKVTFVAKASSKPPTQFIRPEGIASEETFGTATLFSWGNFDPSTVDVEGDDTLVAELITYRDNLDVLLTDHPGEFVLIKGEKIEGVFPSMTEALEAGADRFGEEPALIKKIVASEAPLPSGGLAV